MDYTSELVAISKVLSAHHIRVSVVPAYSIARFVIMRPNEVKPTRFEPQLLTIQAPSLEALTYLIRERIQDMLNSHKGFLDPHEYEAFVVLNVLDCFGDREIWQLTYQSGVIVKNATVDIVTDDSYGSLQDLYNSTLR